MKYPLLIALTIGGCLIILGLFQPVPVSQAKQIINTPRPTATNLPPEEQEEEEPVLILGNVQGFVYNLSAGGAGESGMAVVLDGGGWQAETLTDSNGFYQFAGLGSSQATLNLRLPPDAHPLMPDWSIHTHNPETTRTDLAFYWGDAPPMPVLLSIDPATAARPVNQPFTIRVNVQNRSGSLASEGIIDLKLPASLEVLEALTTHGQIDFSKHRIWDYLGAVQNGETATLTVKVKFDEATFPQNLTIEAVLNYQEQLTQQLVRSNIIGVKPGARVAISSAPISQAAVGQRETSASSVSSDDSLSNSSEMNQQPQPQQQSQQQSQQIEAPTANSADANQMIPQTGASAEDTMAEDQNTQRTEQTTSVSDTTTEIEADTTTAQRVENIPVTGGPTEAAASASLPWPVLILSIIFIVGLSIAGLKTFRQTKT